MTTITLSRRNNEEISIQFYTLSEVNETWYRKGWAIFQKGYSSPKEKGKEKWNSGISII